MNSVQQNLNTHLQLEKMRRQKNQAIALAVQLGIGLVWALGFIKFI